MKWASAEKIKLVLDDGGPFVLWGKSTGGLRSGLFIDAHPCNNPACNCPDVELDVISIDDRFTNLSIKNDKLKFEFVPRNDEAVPPLHSFSANLNIDTGKIDFKNSDDTEQENSELITLLQKGIIKGNHLEALRKRWRLLKGVGKNEWQSKDWSWWKPGNMISWCQIDQDDSNLLFDCDGAGYWADDLYCITPGCPCKTVCLGFSEITNGKPINIGLFCSFRG